MCIVATAAYVIIVYGVETEKLVMKDCKRWPQICGVRMKFCELPEKNVCQFVGWVEQEL